jgi:transposase
MTVPGIGPANALTILAEAGDLRRFRHRRQFLSFCGLNLSTLQSGKSRGQSHLSKYGNARLRTALWAQIRPEFGTLFGPTKSILLERICSPLDSALLRLSPVRFVRPG